MQAIWACHLSINGTDEEWMSWVMEWVRDDASLQRFAPHDASIRRRRRAKQILDMCLGRVRTHVFVDLGHPG